MPQSHPVSPSQSSPLSSTNLGRRQLLKAFGVVGATAVAGPTVLSACSSADPGGAGGGATTGGQVTGEMDFWWNPSVESADAMGKWMNTTISDFQTAHPGTTIHSVTQPAEQMVGNFRTACQSQSGPSLDHQYSGPYTMQFVYENCIAPLDDGTYPSAEFAHVLPPAALNLYKYQGKTWALPWYNAPVVLMYNKALFSAAGLDPEKPPATVDELISIAPKLKASGVTPFGYGLKGLTGTGNFSGLWNLQQLNDPKEILPVVLGKAAYTDPKYSGWLGWVKQMIDGGVFNSDVTSLAYQDSQNMFLAKKSAMCISSSLTNFQKALGKDLGICTTPTKGTGSLAGRIQFNSHPLFITSFAENKQLPSAFLQYLHTAPVLKGMYESSGFFPADDRFDPSVMKTDQDKQLFGFLRDKSVIGYQNYWPSKMDRENLFLGVQSLFAGQGSPEQIAQQIEQRLATWRQQSAADLKNFEAQASS
jgi:ABC-type glycerol-3-phosphate transport system substrate-binding protein